MSKSLREKIYGKVRDDITFGKFLPGERIVDLISQVLRLKGGDKREGCQAAQPLINVSSLGMSVVLNKIDKMSKKG